MVNPVDICCTPICGSGTEEVDDRFHMIGRRSKRRHSNDVSNSSITESRSQLDSRRKKGFRSLSVTSKSRHPTARSAERKGSGLLGIAQWLHRGFSTDTGAAKLDHGARRYHPSHRHHPHRPSSRREHRPRQKERKPGSHSPPPSCFTDDTTPSFVPTYTMPSAQDVPVVLSSMPPKGLQGDPAHLMDESLVNQIRQNLASSGITHGGGLPWKVSQLAPRTGATATTLQQRADPAQWVSGFTASAGIGSSMLKSTSDTELQGGFRKQSEPGVGAASGSLIKPSSMAVLPRSYYSSTPTHMNTTEYLGRTVQPGRNITQSQFRSVSPSTRVLSSTVLSSTNYDNRLRSTPSDVGRGSAKLGAEFHSGILSPRPMVTHSTHGTRSPFGTMSSNLSHLSGTKMTSAISQDDERLIRTQSRVLSAADLTEQHHIIRESVTEREVVVPKKIVTEEIIEKQIIVPERRLIEEVVEEKKIIQEKIVEVAKPVIQEKLVEVKEIVYVEKIVEHPEKVYKEKIVEVPVVRYEERIVEIPKIVTQEKIVEVLETELREVELEKFVEKIVEVDEVRIKEVRVPRYVDKAVPQYVNVEEHVDVHRQVPVPVESLKIFEFKLPRIRARYVQVPLPVYCPRFIEVGVPAELLSATQIQECQTVLDEISLLALESSQRAISLLEIEALGSSGKQMNPKLELQLSGTVLPREAIAHCWASQGYGVVGEAQIMSTATSSVAKIMASLISSSGGLKPSEDNHPADSIPHEVPKRLSSAPGYAVSRMISLLDPHHVSRHSTYDRFHNTKNSPISIRESLVQPHALQQAMTAITAAFGEDAASGVIQLLSGIHAGSPINAQRATGRDAESGFRFGDSLSDLPEAHSARTSERKSIESSQGHLLAESVSARRILSEFTPPQSFVTGSRVVSVTEKSSSMENAARISSAGPKVIRGTVGGTTPAPASDDTPSSTIQRGLQDLLRNLVSDR